MADKPIRLWAVDYTGMSADGPVAGTAIAQSVKEAEQFLAAYKHFGYTVSDAWELTAKEERRIKPPR